MQNKVKKEREIERAESREQRAELSGGFQPCL